jgi:ribosomal protein L30/L7E
VGFENLGWEGDELKKNRGIRGKVQIINNLVTYEGK